MRKRSYLSLMLSLLLIVSFSLMGVHCGGGGHEKHPPKDPKVAPCEPGKVGGTLKVPIAGIPLTLNPFLSITPETYEVTSKLFATLIDYDNANQKAANDGLARSVDTGEDGRSYTIHLREGLAFSNGIPIGADDVIFSLKAALDTRLNSVLGDFMKIDNTAPEFTKIDPLTVKITFPEHYEPIKELLSRIPIVSKSAMEDLFLKADPKSAYPLNTAPDKVVSSGPFMLKSVSEKQIELVYNPYYWKVDSNGTSLPYLDGITYYLKVSRQEQQNNLLTKNEYNVVQLIQSQKQSFEGNDRFVIKDVGPSLSVWQLVLNWRTDQRNSALKATWFRGSYFRWALSSLIDREKMTKDVFGSMANPAYGLINPENKLWYNPNSKKYPYNIKEAQNFLSTSKFSNDEGGNLKDGLKNSVRFTILHYNEYIPAQMANSIIEDLKKVGIQVETDPQDYKKFWNYLNGGLFEVALVETTPLLPDPAFMQPFLSKAGKYVYFNDPIEINFKNAAPGGTDEWINQASRDLNEALKKTSLKDRQDLYNKVQANWTEKCPSLFLVNENILAAAQKNLGNFKPAPVTPNLTWNSEEFYFKQ